MDPVAFIAIAALALCLFALAVLAAAGLAAAWWWRNTAPPPKAATAPPTPAPLTRRRPGTPTPIPPPAARPPRKPADPTGSPDTELFQRGVQAFDDPELDDGEDEANEIFSVRPPESTGLAPPRSRG